MKMRPLFLRAALSAAERFDFSRWDVGRHRRAAGRSGEGVAATVAELRRPGDEFFHDSDCVGAPSRDSAQRVPHRRLAHFADGCLWLGVIFVPYPTSVLTAYLRTPAAKMAATFYSGTFVFMAMCSYLFHSHGIPQTAALFARIVRISLLICTVLWVFWATTITRDTRVRSATAVSDT